MAEFESVQVGCLQGTAVDTRSTPEVYLQVAAAAAAAEDEKNGVNTLELTLCEMFDKLWWKLALYLQNCPGMTQITFFSPFCRGNINPFHAWALGIFHSIYTYLGQALVIVSWAMDEVGQALLIISSARPGSRQGK